MIADTLRKCFGCKKVIDLYQPIYSISPWHSIVFCEQCYVSYLSQTYPSACTEYIRATNATWLEEDMPE